MRILVETSNAVRKYRDPRAAAAAGYDVREARGRPGDRAVGWLHAEHRGFSNDRRYLDPQHPEVLIYANPPDGRPLRLVGVMFSVHRGVKGPTPGGPVTRWHNHRVCVQGDRRGLAPQPGRVVPEGVGGASGQRDDAPVVHARPARRVRDPRAGARALPRRTARPPRLPCRRRARADDVATSSPILERVWAKRPPAAPARRAGRSRDRRDGRAANPRSYSMGGRKQEEDDHQEDDDGGRDHEHDQNGRPEHPDQPPGVTFAGQVTDRAG